MYIIRIIGIILLYITECVYMMCTRYLFIFKCSVHIEIASVCWQVWKV